MRLLVGSPDTPNHQSHLKDSCLNCTSVMPPNGTANPQGLKRITSRNAIAWNTLFGLTIAQGAVRYLTRQ